MRRLQQHAAFVVQFTDESDIDFDARRVESRPVKEVSA
jgi:hypothetical protein